jgi:hypothetical protein
LSRAARPGFAGRWPRYRSSFRNILSPDSYGGDTVMWQGPRQRHTAGILVPARRRTGQLDRSGRYRDLPDHSRAGDRAAISIYHEQHCQGLRRDRCPHVRAGQIPQGLRMLCRQSRRNNAEYPVRYGSHGRRNELGLATDRRVGAFSREAPVTQRHTIDRHHLEANPRCSAAWTGLLEARGSLVEVLVEAASRGSTGYIMLELARDMWQMRTVPLHRSDGIARPSA